jgi:tRNA (guanine37-N1)-methyltransferase
VRFDLLTVFPEIISSLTRYSILERAVGEGLLQIVAHNLRDFTQDRHRSTDDYPFGGGPGMVMLAAPILRAWEDLATELGHPPYTVLLGPAGERFDQSQALALAAREEICLVCGHYEGIDDRVRALADLELSVGDFVTLGGELPAMLVVDATSRLLPGVLGNTASLESESFSAGLLEYAQFTRPATLSVPEVYLSGHHARINQWRRKDSLLRTLLFRPDLLCGSALGQEERKLLCVLRAEIDALLGGSGG